MQFTGSTYFLNNKTTNGGAILATEYTIVTGGEITIIADNVVTFGRSNVVFEGSCSISKNQAVMGGGIYASSSIINVYQSSVLLSTNNNGAHCSVAYGHT